MPSKNQEFATYCCDLLGAIGPCVLRRMFGGYGISIQDPLHNSSRVRVDRIGMDCKADFAANSTAIGKKFNAADRPSPGYHGPRGVTQRVLNGLTVAIMTDLGQGEKLWLKADDESRALFEAAGCQRFGYLREGVSRGMNYYSAPEEAMDSQQQMAPWARLALEAALKAKLTGKVIVKVAAKAKPKAKPKVIKATVAVAVAVVVKKSPKPVKQPK